jgi:hypothetical protein
MELRQADRHALLPPPPSPSLALRARVISLHVRTAAWLRQSAARFLRWARRALRTLPARAVAALPPPAREPAPNLRVTEILASIRAQRRPCPADRRADASASTMLVREASPTVVVASRRRAG